MAVTFVAGDAATGAVTAALDSSTANFAIIACGSWPGAATTITEGGGYTNTWIPLPDLTLNQMHHRLFWARLTSKGAGHTFQHNGGSPCIAVALLAGVPATGNPIASMVQIVGGGSPGTVTPTLNGSLILSAANCEGGTWSAVSGGLTIVDTAIGAGGNIGGTLAYLAQTTAAAVTPVWSGTASSNRAATTIVITPTALPDPVSVVAHTKWFVRSGTTSSAIDTTGATLIVLAMDWWDQAMNPPTDSKGNVWKSTPAANGPTGPRIAQLWYTVPTSVGPGHTFTTTLPGADTNAALFVAAYTGIVAPTLEGSQQVYGNTPQSVGLYAAPAAGSFGVLTHSHTAALNTNAQPSPPFVVSDTNPGTGGFMSGGLAAGSLVAGQPVTPTMVGPTATYTEAVSFVSFVAAANISTYQTAVIADGASAYWPLDDLVGSAFAREVIGGRTAAIQGGTILNQAGVGAGKAMVLDGTGKLLPLTLPSIALNFTVEAWIKPTATPTQMPILTRVMGADGDFDWSLRSGPATIQLVFRTGGSNVSRQWVTPGVVQNAWSHVVITGSSSSLAIYVNGAAAGTPLGTTLVGAGGGLPGIGSMQPVSTGQWVGALQDVAMYPRALSAAEVLAHYTVQTTPVTPPPDPVVVPPFPSSIGTTDANGSLRVKVVTPGAFGPVNVLPHSGVRLSGGQLQIAAGTLGPSFGILTNAGNLGVKVDASGVLATVTRPIGSQLTALTPLGNLMLRTDNNGFLCVAYRTYTGPTIAGPLGGAMVRADENGSLIVTEG